MNSIARLSQWYSRTAISDVPPVIVNMEAAAVSHGTPSAVTALGPGTAEPPVTASIYEQSCKAYKHKGNVSGYYYIDVDSSGPIKPQLLYCNMTGAALRFRPQHHPVTADRSSNMLTAK
ncbi:contactin-associated protein-like 3B [Oreochromis niloticus]|uniref:contactin-associated protein-like 3B n=1 Tax=Oreochromis niloticus TaxID=8128 RepID=UPI000DF3193B|nr:contactin-associated protein-like 3B [Oreochromis niloticus]CAI5674934.1 unnamed protein product [Mustela putorius furo]